MTTLVSCFVLQAWVVYSDEPGPVVLEGSALRGARLWHTHNCQACHQLFGFGGFLGGDLTNISARLGEAGLVARLEMLLAKGSGQMPAFGLGSTEAHRIAAFLVAMDQTGTGELRAAVGHEHARIEAATQELLSAAGEAEKEGARALAVRPCKTCHRRFEIGVNEAPALAGIAARLSESELTEVLTRGRPPRMPPPHPPFSDPEKVQVIAFLRWLAHHRAELHSMAADSHRFSFSEIPWFEFVAPEAR